MISARAEQRSEYKTLRAKKIYDFTSSKDLTEELHRTRCAVVSLRTEAWRESHAKHDIMPKGLIYRGGDDSREDPPVPIPNTEVKLSYADGTALAGE